MMSYDIFSVQNYDIPYYTLLHYTMQHDMRLHDRICYEMLRYDMVRHEKRMNYMLRIKIHLIDYVTLHAHRKLPYVVLSCFNLCRAGVCCDVLCYLIVRYALLYGAIKLY